MSKLKKILDTVIIFIVVMFIICFMFSLYKALVGDIPLSDIFSETGLYFLYTIGYGALEGDSVIQNILAMVGIISLALMTTFLTINLFWRLDDVKLNKEIFYENDHLKISFRNRGQTICDMKATFVLYDENHSENILDPKEYYMPILVKKSAWNITPNLNETFWYKVVHSLLTTTDKKLYCVFSFVDTKSGQNSIKVEQITRNNIKNGHDILTYEEFIKPIILQCQNLLPIENNGTLSISKTEVVDINYKFSKKSDDNSFVMLYYDFHEQFLNFEKYNKDDTYLEVPFKSSNNINVCIEIKLANSTISRKITINNQEKIVRLSLKDIPNNLEEIREICYTIFNKDNASTGDLQIGDLKIITR